MGAGRDASRGFSRGEIHVVGIFHYARGRRGRGAWDEVPVLQGNYVSPLDERMAGAPGGGAI